MLVINKIVKGGEVNTGISGNREQFELKLNRRVSNCNVRIFGIFVLDIITHFMTSRIFKILKRKFDKEKFNNSR